MPACHAVIGHSARAEFPVTVRRSGAILAISLATSEPLDRESRFRRTDAARCASESRRCARRRSTGKPWQSRSIAIPAGAAWQAFAPRPSRSTTVNCKPPRSSLAEHATGGRHRHRFLRRQRRHDHGRNRRSARRAVSGPRAAALRHRGYARSATAMRCRCLPPAAQLWDLTCATSCWSFPSRMVGQRRRRGCAMIARNAKTDRWVEDFLASRRGQRLTHLISIERPGPSHTLESLAAQPRQGRCPRRAVRSTTCRAEDRDTCHNMRGQPINALDGQDASAVRAGRASAGRKSARSASATAATRWAWVALPGSRSSRRSAARRPAGSPAGLPPISPSSPESAIGAATPWRWPSPDCEAAELAAAIGRAAGQRALIESLVRERRGGRRPDPAPRADGRRPGPRRLLATAGGNATNPGLQRRRYAGSEFEYRWRLRDRTDGHARCVERPTGVFIRRIAACTSSKTPYCSASCWSTCG